MSPDPHSRLAPPRHKTSPHLAAAPHTHPHPNTTPHTTARTHAAPSIASQPALPARGRGLTTRGLFSGWSRTVGVATPHLAAHIPKHRGRPCTGAMAAPHNLPLPLASRPEPRAPDPHPEPHRNPHPDQDVQTWRGCVALLASFSRSCRADVVYARLAESRLVHGRSPRAITPFLIHPVPKKKESSILILHKVERTALVSPVGC